VRDRNERGSSLVFSILIGRTHRGLDPKDHVAEHIIDGRKQPGTGVLFLGRPCTPGMQLVSAQYAFQRASPHHSDGALFDKTLEDFAQHGDLLLRVR
jgi:hypothetical protein